MRSSRSIPLHPDDAATPWLRVLAVARRQGGVVARRQLVPPLSSSTVAHLERTGRLHRVHRGVYAVGRPDLTRSGREWAAVLAAGPAAVLCRRTAAAAMHVLDWDGAVEVAVPGSGRRVPGVLVFRRRTLDPADVVRPRHGVPHLAWLPTVLDLATFAGVPLLESVLDRSEARGLLDLDGLDAALARGTGRPGAADLRSAMDLFLDVPEGERRSLLERLGARVVARSDLPCPELNVPVAVGRGYVIDLAWVSLRVAVELDGRRWHGGARAFESDRERDRELVKAGWIVLRFTYRDVRRRPDHVARDIRVVLGRRRAALVRSR